MVSSNSRLGALLIGIYTALFALSLLGILVLK
jgi:hypothetical protein